MDYRLAILAHLLYRFFRTCMHLLFTFWFVYKKSEKAAFKNPLKINKIFYRYKLSELNLAKIQDFVYYFAEYREEEFLLDPRWSLYAVDRKMVHFVYLKNSEKHYNAVVAPFFYIHQYKDALMVASMDLEKFFQFSKKVKPIQCNTVCLSSAARSGSTLVAKMLQCHDKITVYGEPDYFTMLTSYYDIRLPHDLCANLLTSGVTYFCRNFNADETIVLKTRSNCVTLVPLFVDCLPFVKHAYVFRHDYKKIIASTYRMMFHMGNQDIYGKILAISTTLSTWMFTEHITIVLEEGSKNSSVDRAILFYLKNYAQAYKNLQLRPMPWLYYEDLIENPKTAMQPLFEICKLPSECLASALQVLEKDSQSGTTLNKKRMASIRVDNEEMFNEENMATIHKFCQDLGVKDIFTEKQNERFN